MVELTFTSIYIINQVKIRRMILGISPEGLAEEVGMSDSYISGVESNATKSQYTLEVLSKIKSKLKCEVRDFYPPNELLLENDGSKIPKEIISLSDIKIAKKVIDGMIEIGYFEKPKPLIDILKYLHIHGRPESPIVQLALDEAVNNRRMKISDGFYHQA